jgi:glucose-6-phosphate 1-epimerase
MLANLCEAKLPTGETVAVSPYGGQVVSWRDHTGHELLYLSPLSRADGASAIRGGVPVCFPQFASRGPGIRHGFARTCTWSEVQDAGLGAVHMRLEDDEDTRRAWPHRFRLDLLAVVQPGSLRVQLTVHNTDAAPWSFTAALHTYLRTAQVTAAVLDGLADRPFEDALAAGAMRRDAGPDLSQALDRVYPAVTQGVVLRDGGRALAIEQSGFTDMVVWNPGAQRAAKLADLPPGGHEHMLCVEAAQVMAPIELQPGAAWVGSQTLRQP